MSAVLGAGGYLTVPQTTQTLHSQGTLSPGPGLVTIYDRFDSDGEDHVIINIAGTWYESGGTTSAGPHVMTAAAAAAQLAQGGFEPFHPTGMTRRTIGTNNDGGAPTYGGTRPGGEPADTGQAVDAQFDEYGNYLAASSTQNPSDFVGLSWRDFFWGIPGIGEDPLTGKRSGNPFTGPADAIESGLDFLKWIAHIFSPHNILRCVEFLAGAGLAAAGLSTIMKSVTGAGPISTAARTAPGRLIVDAGEATAVGRVTREVRGRKMGKREAQRQQRNAQHAAAHRKGKTTEQKRQRARADRQGKRKAKRTNRIERLKPKSRRDDIPF